MASQADIKLPYITINALSIILSKTSIRNTSLIHYKKQLEDIATHSPELSEEVCHFIKEYEKTYIALAQKCHAINDKLSKLEKKINQ